MYDDAMSDEEIDRRLAGGVKSAKFDTVGVVIRGRVISKELQAQKDMETGEPLFWKDGNPKTQIKVVVQTEDRDEDDSTDDGRRALYLKGGLEAAVRQALQTAKSKLLIGGELAVQYTGDGEPSKRGWNPPKQYKAKYTPPAPASAVSVDDL